jgi:hypothetical protein
VTGPLTQEYPMIPTAIFLLIRRVVKRYLTARRAA